MVLLLFKILRLEQKIVNQLSRRIINSLLSLECFLSKNKNEIADFEYQKGSIDDAFIKITGKELQ